MNRRIGIRQTKVENIGCKGFVSKKRFYLGKFVSLIHSRYLPFDENGPSFVEPKVFPILAGYTVTSPAVGHLVGGYINLRLITNNDGWRSESEQRIFHASHRERWRKHKDGIVSPNIVAHIFFTQIE